MGEPASCTQRATRFISSDHLDEVARIATRISVIAKRSTRRPFTPNGIDIERLFSLVHHAMANTS